MDQELATIHYSELPPGSPGTPLYEEWELYRRESARLLSEGHESRWILIKGREILGIFDTHESALREGTKRYRLQPFLIHQIVTREPLLRGPIFRTCHS